MNALIQQKKKVDEWEVECRMLKNLVINIIKDSQSTTLNKIMSINYEYDDLREEDIVYQILESMDLEKQDPLPLTRNEEEAINLHDF